MRKNFINIQAESFNLLPSSLRYTLNSARLIPRYLHWNMNPRGRAHSRKILSPYKDKYKGYRCVVIGNGPSLKKMNLDILKNEYTFGLNRIYLLFKEWGFSTSFLVSINNFVLEQFSTEITSQSPLKVLGWVGQKSYTTDNNLVFLSQKPKLDKMIDGNILDGYFPSFWTVTNVAIELAYFMGFSEVILIGVDHNFVEKGTGGKAIVANGPDQNHFSPNYFGKGITWQLPNYRMMEKGYKGNKQLYEQNGRRIVDATVDGKLTIFQKVEFGKHLKQSNLRNKLT